MYWRDIGHYYFYQLNPIYTDVFERFFFPMSYFRGNVQIIEYYTSVSISDPISDRQDKNNEVWWGMGVRKL